MWKWQPFKQLIGVDIIIGIIGEHQSELFDEEITYVASAVAARVREYTAGRSLARFLLSHRDIHPKSVSTGPGGQPIWPAGITGSISHTALHVGVAIASQDRYQGIGLDIEVAGNVDEVDANLVMTSKELSCLHGSPPMDHVARIFSCKEAVFKAVFPVIGEHFEFHDVEISLNGDNFRAVMTKGARSAGLTASGCGLIEAHTGMLATIFCV